MKVNCSYQKLVPLDQLIPHPQNANQHSTRQIEMLAKIIKYQGWRHPIIVSGLSGYIVAGHGRLASAKLAGFTECPVDVQQFEDKAQEMAFLLSDNFIAELAETDESKLEEIYLELGEFDHELLGLEEPLVIIDEDKEATEDDVLDVGTNPISKLGDVYELGEHRLMCGSSLENDHINKLMNNSLARLWLTDPPYGVSYKSNGAEYKHTDIANDSLPLDEMKIFWTKVATNALSACDNEAPYYWFACQGGDQMMMMMSLGDGGWQVKHELMWLKNTLVLGRCDYHYKHEPILYGWKKKGKHNWYGDRSQTSVIECKKPASSDIHPTMKPIELLEPLIINSSRQSDIVLDTFGGSGSTMIACQKHNRKCYSIEIEPKYVDAAIGRYCKYVGNYKIKRNGEEMQWPSVAT